jgi:prolyl oligopeptidase PreP (S9A serine peptidase family)
VTTASSALGRRGRCAKAIRNSSGIPFRRSKTSRIHCGIAPGIAIGHAIEEQPALFAAVALNAPTPHMLRSETTEVGAYSVSEFGSTDAAGGFAALAAMSPYEHASAGTHLPPVLVRSGAPYDLGVDWQPAKFVARLPGVSIPRSDVVTCPRSAGSSRACPREVKSGMSNCSEAANER